MNDDSSDQKISSKKKWRDWLGEGFFGRRILLAFLFLISLFMFLHFRQVRIEPLELNTTSERYIIGQVDFQFPDEEATLIIKQQSIRDIGSIYRLNEKQIRQLRFDFESFLIAEQKWRDQLEAITFDEIYKGIEALEEALIKARFTNGRTLSKINAYRLPSENYFLFYPTNIQEPITIPKDLWESLRAKVFQPSIFHSETSAFIINAFENQPWLLQEDISTQRTLRQLIQLQVPDQFTHVKAGTRLIEPGEKVASRHLSMLQSMKETIANERNLWAPRTIIGSLLLSFLFTFLSIIYFRFNHSNIINSLQKMILLVCIVALTLIFSKIAEHFLVNKATYLTDIFRYPIIVPFAAILIFLLVGAEVALFCSAFLTIVLGVTLAMDHGQFLVINLIASWITILLSKKIHKRKEIFSVLGKVWLACLPVILAFNLAHNVFIPLHLFQDFVSSFVFITAIALLVIGLLPILESMFGVVTEMSLMEYMDPNNELLRRLSQEAPGTYQHCLVVGNLSEAAAQAIGSNGLFCRVATLYHDIGKLVNPHYFTENQMGGFDIHQLLTPMESAQVIVAHVTEGEVLAKKHGLPQSFIEIIREHHGTTLVYYFYHKQLESLSEEAIAKIDQRLFRYPGPKPYSKESAIIMLADSIEAASRSLTQVSEEALTEMVEKLIEEKGIDGQLDQCQLTFEELGVVKKSFIQTLLITGHLRIKYPEKALTQNEENAFA